MVCRSVQVWFPRVETSGGQSGGRIVVWGGVMVVVEEGLVFCFVMATQSAKGVQERHLWFRCH